MSVRGDHRRDTAQPAPVPQRCDQRRRLRRAGGAPADLRLGARPRRPRRANTSCSISSCSMASAARRPDAKPHRELSIELRDALLARKREMPQMRILVIADPINDVYGGLPSRDLAALRGAGIEVVTPDLDGLRDSNPIYSAFWRLTMKWWSGDGSGDASLPNPLDAGPDQVTFGAWARLLNFKANHRKVIIGDDGKGGIAGIVTSANPHDASSLHSNVALKLSRRGAAAAARKRAGDRRAKRAGTAAGSAAEATGRRCPSPENTARVQVLTEGEIRAAIVRNFARRTRRRQHRHRDVLPVGSRRDPGAAGRGKARRGGARAARSQQGCVRPHQERHPEPLGGHRARSGVRRRDPGALVPHARRAVPQQAHHHAHRHGILVHARLAPTSRDATWTISISRPMSRRAFR